MLILDIRNWISTSNNSYFWYQQLPSQLLISEINFQISELNIVTSDHLIADIKIRLFTSKSCISDVWNWNFN